MFIPPQKHVHRFAKEKPKAEVYLDANHICFQAELVKRIFGEEENVFVAIYPDKSYLLISPVSNTFFPKMHESNQHLLKAKNLTGAKSLAIHEYIIDHDLQLTNNNLQWEALEKNKMISISWQ